jgi:hypothetical protein
MKTVIISNVHREPLAWPHFKDFNPIRSFTPDYPQPKLGQMRCRTGTTNALKAYAWDEPYALVVEDDCVPDDRHDWRGAINVGTELLADYEIVCLHGRGWQTETGHNKFAQFKKGGWTWLYPTVEHRWVLGTLIYLIREDAIKKFCNDDFWVDQTNIDLYLYSKRYNFCMLANGEKVFIHDRSQGSLLENGKNTEYVNR